MKATRIALTILAFAAAATLLSAATSVVYRGNVKSRIFHQPSCRYFTAKNCTATFETREAAGAAGYRPCKVCNP